VLSRNFGQQAACQVGLGRRGDAIVFLDAGLQDRQNSSAASGKWQEDFKVVTACPLAVLSAGRGAGLLTFFLILPHYRPDDADE
jgi:hypothetical protein